MKAFELLKAARRSRPPAEVIESKDIYSLGLNPRMGICAPQGRVLCSIDYKSQTKQ